MVRESDDKKEVIDKKSQYVREEKYNKWQKQNKMIKMIITKRYVWLIRENKKEERRIKMIIKTRDKLEREGEDKNYYKKVKIMINRIIT